MKCLKCGKKVKFGKCDFCDFDIKNQGFYCFLESMNLKDFAKRVLDKKSKITIDTGWRDVKSLLSDGESGCVVLHNNGTIETSGHARFRTGACYASGERIDNIALYDEYSGYIGTYANGKAFATRSDKHYRRIPYLSNVKEIKAGREHAVALFRDGRLWAACSIDRKQCEIDNWTNIIAIECGDYYTIGLCADGKVLLTGSYFAYPTACKEKIDKEISGITDHWTDIVAIACTKDYIVGVKRTGTLVFEMIGENRSSSLEQALLSWEHIKNISMRNDTVLGVKTDGTVVTNDNEADFSQWADIKDVYCGKDYYFGIRNDGSVICQRIGFDPATCKNVKRLIQSEDSMPFMICNDNSVISSYGQSIEIEKTIADIVGYNDDFLCLFTDGTVEHCSVYNDDEADDEYDDEDDNDDEVDDEESEECDFEDWEGIKSIGYCFEVDGYVGLRSDGTILTSFGHNNTWKNITQIACGHDFFAGLTAEGIVKIAVFDSNVFTKEIENEVTQWKNIIQIKTGYRGRKLCALTKNGKVISSDGTAISQPLFNGKQVKNFGEQHSTLVVLYDDGTVKECWIGNDGKKNRFTSKGMSGANSIAIGEDSLAVMKPDGTVKLDTPHEYKKSIVHNWVEVEDVAIERMYSSTAYDVIFGLKKDGSILYTRNFC